MNATRKLSLSIFSTWQFRVSAVEIGKHIPALDGIRGAAVLLVIFYHLVGSIGGEFGFNPIFLKAGTFGWCGVDMFFVLSGFLITGILYDSKGGGHYFKNFYMRRVLRILPLYYGALLFIGLLRTLWPNLETFGTANPIWMWTYLTNVGLAWLGPTAFGFAFHFWSLAIEEHFYLVWPIAVFMWDRQRLLYASIGLFILSVSLRITLVLLGVDLGVIYVLTLTRLDGLAVGAFLALWVRRPEGLQSLARPTFVMSMATGLGIAAVILFRQTLYPLDVVMQLIGYPLLALFFGSVLILALTSPLQMVANLPVLRWFGKYSYGLYVWHFMIFVLVFHSPFARSIRNGRGPVEMAVSIAIALTLTLGVTFLSWHLWEKQFLKLKERFA